MSNELTKHNTDDNAQLKETVSRLEALLEKSLEAKQPVGFLGMLSSAIEALGLPEKQAIANGVLLAKAEEAGARFLIKVIKGAIVETKKEIVGSSRDDDGFR